MTIRKAQKTDLLTISEIVQKTIAEIYPHYYPAGAVKFFQEHHSLHNIEKDIESGNVYYLTAQGIPVSTVTIEGNEINRLFVLPEFQGRGFGSMLMDFAEQQIGERFPAAILSSSFSAQEMYLKRGYSAEKFQKIQCENGDQLCFYLMQKSLRTSGAGIDHIAIFVHDLEQSRRFYETYFRGLANQKYHNPKTGLQTYFLTFADGARLELMSHPACENTDRSEFSQGFAHLAFRVGSRDAVDALTARLAADGYIVAGQPRTTGDGYYESVVLDPDGNRIEITE